MKAKLKSLERKYYGTWVDIEDDDGNPVGGMTIWLNPIREEDYEPSEREGMDAQDICDNHYEPVLTLKIANKIVEAINGMERSS